MRATMRLRRMRSGASSCRPTACSTSFARASSARHSPSHFFWGSFDLAVTRFSGRAAPPLHVEQHAERRRLGDERGLLHTNARASASGPATAATARRRSMPMRIPSRRAFGAAPVAAAGRGLQRRRRAVSARLRRGAHRRHRRTMRCSTSCRAPMRRRPIGAKWDRKRPGAKGEQMTTQYFGIYRGTVVNNIDPTRTRPHHGNRAGCRRHDFDVGHALRAARRQTDGHVHGASGRRQRVDAIRGW